MINPCLRGCSQTMIRMLCCYKFAITLKKFFGILDNIAKIFFRVIANFSTQIIRSRFVNILLGLTKTPNLLENNRVDCISIHKARSFRKA